MNLVVGPSQVRPTSSTSCQRMGSNCHQPMLRGFEVEQPGACGGARQGTIFAWLRGNDADLDLDLLLFAVRPPSPSWYCQWATRWLTNNATCGARPSWLPLGVSISDSSSEELQVATHQWASTGQYALQVVVNRGANKSRSDDSYTYRLWTAWRQNATGALHPLPVSSR